METLRHDSICSLTRYELEGYIVDGIIIVSLIILGFVCYKILGKNHEGVDNE